MSGGIFGVYLIDKLATYAPFFFVFNALLTQKIVTTVSKNRKVKREKKKKEKRIKPTHTARQ